MWVLAGKAVQVLYTFHSVPSSLFFQVTSGEIVQVLFLGVTPLNCAMRRAISAWFYAFCDQVQWLAANWKLNSM